VAQAEKYDCNCGEWSERLVIQNPTAAATEFCSQMCRLSMKLCSGPWATRVKVGAGCGLSRSALFNMEPRPGCRFDGSFLLGGQVA